MKAIFLNYSTGHIVRVLFNVYNIHPIGKGCLLLFGDNIIKQVSLRSFKINNLITTGYASPAFTLDARKSLIVVGSYWDIYIYDLLLRLRYTKLRAHGMNVACVKFINASLIASTREDYHLSLWEIKDSQKSDIHLQRIFNYNLHYVIPTSILLHPKERHILFLVSRNLINCISFNNGFDSYNKGSHSYNIST